MLGYGDEEIQEMLAAPESDLVERKQSYGGDAPTKIREVVCAFANDLPDHRRPGMVAIGLGDDGNPTGLDVDDELLRKLGEIRDDGNIVPPPTISVSQVGFRGHGVAVILVAPSDSPPVRFRGRIWVRIGPRRAIASEQEERILNEKRRHGDRPFDTRPVPSARLEDLSRSVFEAEYLPSAFAPDVLEANERTYEQRLAATKMIASATEATPTALGLLVLSPRTRDFIPGAYIQFLRIQGFSLSDPVIDEQEIDGTVRELLRRIDDKLDSHNRTAVDIRSGDVESRRSSYPRVALQQIVRNAVMHRTYEATNAPVRIIWYDDRIEIVSPGGPFGTVRRDNFGQPGATDYRNPGLAEAMRVLGFVQRFGVGIATARAELEKNGNPPLELDVQPTLVSVTLRAAS